MALTKRQQDKLEDDALRAFSGSSSRDLVHGFRVNTGKGQVAAVYWSNLNAGNDVEIALAESRLTDLFDAMTVHHWIQRQRALNPRVCNVHKPTSDWPIFGFRLPEVEAFLDECKQLRIGFLRAEMQSDLNRRRAAESPQDREVSRLVAELASLRPNRQHAVIDLVSQARISTKRWYVKDDGEPAATPRSNPAYCYRWVFGGGEEPTLVCVWHSSLSIVDGHIKMEANIRLLAEQLEAFAANKDHDVDHRDRARMQGGRARQLDVLLAAAAEQGAPLRVVINEGDMRAEEDLGRDASIVRVRRLDTVTWQIEDYNRASGAVVLCRGRTNGDAAALAVTAPSETSEQYVDQHDLRGSDSPDRKAVTGSSYVRDSGVRIEVLQRAAGSCEWCGAEGFRTAAGQLYVETHHVVPLAEGGADRVWNVAALCPNHHREAHSGTRATEIRADLLTMLRRHYPDKQVPGCWRRPKSDPLVKDLPGQI